MKLQLNTTAVWVLRILVSALFFLSAVAKLFPIWAFEKQLVELGFTDWCQSPYLARLIISLEFAIGILLLQRNFLRRIVLPVTALVLTVFTLHLLSQIIMNGNAGNCGCFGQLIPMTPLQAVIKNILTLGILFLIWKNVSDEPRPSAENSEAAPAQSHSISPLIMAYLASALAVFMLFPFCPCGKEDAANDTLIQPVENVLVLGDSLHGDSTPTTVHDTLKSATPVRKSDTAAARMSPGAGAEKKPASNPDKKIICYFAPGCDHCRETCKEICGMTNMIPPGQISIVFIDDEADKIPDFFKFAGCQFAYRVLDPGKFWTELGIEYNTPGVKLTDKGKVTKVYDGINENKFDAAALKKWWEGK